MSNLLVAGERLNAGSHHSPSMTALPDAYQGNLIHYRIKSGVLPGSWGSGAGAMFCRDQGAGNR
jgi:hypothetical protein